MNLREHLYAIQKKRGELTPRGVVEEAQDPHHPLHPRFEWDDKVAGHQYRLEQARSLIREIEVTYKRPDGQTSRVREFHAVRRNNTYAYESLDQIKQDPITRQILLRDMKRDWESMRARYETFIEFWKMVDEATKSSLGS